MPRIIVIDDSASMRVFLEQTLEGAGYTVETAADGKEGLARLHQASFDLIVTDIYMPETDGLETIRSTRKQGLAPRVIAISSKDSIVNMLPAARMLGADATLQKPFTAAQLLALVAEVLARPTPGSSISPR